VYTSVNIEDSKAMKRLSYVTMIFLPASFVAVSFAFRRVRGVRWH
jgi:Mg2+ and Co2+ transporter CorA